MRGRPLLLGALALVLATSAAVAAPAGAGEAPQPVRVDSLDAPKTARATAKLLVRVERGLRGEDRDPARLARLGRSQQLAYRQLDAHPEWVADVLGRVPAALVPVVQANVDASVQLTGLTGEAPEGFPAWIIREPQPIRTLFGFYNEAAAASGIPWAYLAAIHLVETRMGRIHGTSTAGAQGPMQFIQATWDGYGEGGDINDDRDAILAAGRYLDDRGGPEDMDRALFAYNNDDRYVAAIKAYASVLLLDSRAYAGYHKWQVFYRNVDGTFLLPEGFRSPSA